MHRNQVSAIIAAAPEDYRKWLVEKLKYGNEPNLRQRMKELFDRVRPFMTEIVSKRSLFINRVVNTRNYFAHHGASSKSQAVAGERLYWYTCALTHMLHALLLLELGFTPDEARVCLLRAKGFRMLKSMTESWI